jgi:hypothetical protein
MVQTCMNCDNPDMPPKCRAHLRRQIAHVMRLVLLILFLLALAVWSYADPVFTEQEVLAFARFRAKQNQCRLSEAREIQKIFINHLEKRRETNVTYDLITKLLGPPTRAFKEGYVRYDVTTNCNELAPAEEHLELFVMGDPNPGVVFVGKHPENKKVTNYPGFLILEDRAKSRTRR